MFGSPALLLPCLLLLWPILAIVFLVVVPLQSSSHCVKRTIFFIPTGRKLKQQDEATVEGVNTKNVEVNMLGLAHYADDSDSDNDS